MVYQARPSNAFCLCVPHLKASKNKSARCSYATLPNKAEYKERECIVGFDETAVKNTN